VSERLPVGELIVETFHHYRAHAGPLLSIAALIFLPITLLSEIVGEQSLAAGTGVTLALSGSAIYLYTGLVAPFARPAAGVADRLASPATTSSGLATPSAPTGPSAGGIWGGTAPVATALILAGLAYTVATSIGVLLLIIPGLILVTIWAAAPAVIRLERTGAVAGFRRSRELVRGHGWRVFGLVVSISLLMLAVSLVIQGVAIATAGENTGTFIGSWLGVVIAAPPLGLMPTVLYGFLTERGAAADSAPAEEPPDE